MIQQENGKQMNNKLFKKLNFKDQQEILSLNHPQWFQKELSEMSEFAKIQTNIDETDSVDFVIVFATTQKEVNDFTNQVAPKLTGDAVFWFCYPKKSSKKYNCEFNRDTGWGIMANFDLEPVRQVAIDEDWSALRFRKVDHIKKSPEGKAMRLPDKRKIERQTGTDNGHEY